MMTRAAPETTLEKKELSSVEVEQRVAILKRFRELLTQQRNRFREYLHVLDKQKDVIEQGSPDDLITHVELEEKIITDIFAIQKVIDPLETIYRIGEAKALPGEVREVPGLRAALEELRSEAVLRSAQNKSLLAKRMEELRLELKTLRANPYAIHRSVFSNEGAALVDIKG
jgi:hypothetical protein